MQTIPIQNKLSAIHLGEQSPLFSLIAAKTQSRENQAHDCWALDEIWPAGWWGLDNSKLFQKLDCETQRAVLSACNRTILNEAYFIEKSGLAYTAKMVLLAESTDRAQLYALIGADEAKHLAWIEPYIPDEDKTRPCGQFLAFLSGLIEEAPPRLLVYLVQIILEGWGLEHYKHLAEGCQLLPLRAAFFGILKDEALHHKSGKILFNTDTLSASDWLLLKNTLICYTEMVRVGPLAAIEVIDRTIGGLSLQEVESLLIALAHPAATQQKLLLLKALMTQSGTRSLVNELEIEGYFAPLPLRTAAQLYLDSR